MIFPIDVVLKWSARRNGLLPFASLWGNSEGVCGWQLYVSSGEIYFIYSTEESSYNSKSVSWSPSGNTEYHFEIDRSGSTLYFFVNGTCIGTADIGTDVLYTSLLDYLRIAQSGDALHMDEFRLSNGVARHTANFTPPTSEYSSGATQFDESIEESISLVDELQKVESVEDEFSIADGNLTSWHGTFVDTLFIYDTPFPAWAKTIVDSLNYG